MSPIPPSLAKPTGLQRTRIARRRKRMVASVGGQLDAGIVDHLQHAINTQMNGIVGMLDMLQQTDLTVDQRTMLDILQTNAEKLLGESGRLLRWNVKDPADIDVNPTSAALAGYRMLLIHANLESQTKMQQLLAAHDVAIECHTTSATALGALTNAATQGNPYRIILLDQHLQGLDGETLGQAISNDPAYRDSLLVLIGGDHAQRVERLAQSGFSAWLPDPYPASMLLDTLNTLCTSIAGKEAPRFINAGVPVDDHTAAINFLPFDGRRVLAVDDNPINLQVVERMLARLGCVVDTASGGKQALQLAKQQNYDLILMDCQMPKLDGYQTTALLRAAEDESIHTTIVGWSARAGRKERDTCLAIGMDDFIAKPVRLQDLNALLARWLQASGESAVAVSAEADDELDATLEMFGDDFPELANLFLTDTPKRIASLQQAVTERDTVAIAKLAHAMCGSSASIGATALAAICRDLEIRARNGAVTDAARMSTMEKEYARIDAKLHAMLQNATASHRRDGH